VFFEAVDVWFAASTATIHVLQQKQQKQQQKKQQQQQHKRPTVINHCEICLAFVFKQYRIFVLF
jgi:hypothetical protein